MNATADSELIALESGALDPARFPHLEHLRLGYEMLGRYPFAEATHRFSAGLKQLVQKAGRPEAYNETITIAFLSLIAERRAENPTEGWAKFIATNPDLANKRYLERWYPAGLLRSELARSTFILPRMPDLSRLAGWLAGVFAGYICWSSAVTMARTTGENWPVMILAIVELIGAMLFGFAALRTSGLIILLPVFVTAATAAWHFGEIPARFLYYAITALLLWKVTGPMQMVRPSFLSRFAQLRGFGAHSQKGADE